MATAGADGRRDGRTPAPVIALLSVAVALAAAPGPAGAADEPSAELLPGDAHSAVIVDLEGDGAGEIVRIVAEDPARPIVEAWGFRDGVWELIGTASIPLFDVPGVGDGSAVVAWRADGRARALVLISCCSASPDGELPTCCLAAYELVRTPGGVKLEPRLEDAQAADFVHAIDVDGDGTDELVRSANSYTGESGEIEVLRRNGDAFTSEFLADVEGGMYGFWAGDSDGVEGHDILLGPMPDGNLRRIAWVDGSLRAEEAHLDLGERFDGYPMAVASGAILLSMANELQVITWPRGQRPVRTARLTGLVYPYGGIVEAGSRTLLAVQAAGLQLGQSTPSLGIYDLDLRELGRVEVSPIAARVERLLGGSSGTSRPWQRYLFPYSGPLEALVSSPARGFVWAGMLIEADGDDGYRAQPIAPLLGLQALGFAGPEDGWAVLSSGYMNAGNAAYLYPGSVPPGWGRMSLVPVEDVLQADGVAATIELRNAVEVGRTAGDVTELIADREGFEVEVNAPQGSWVVAQNRRSFSELTVESEPLVVEVSPRGGRDDEAAEDRPIDASLIVATPDGHATVFEWSGTFVAGPPELSVSGRTDALSFGATLEGTTSPHATVSVDGEAVGVSTDGGFAVAVDAGLWPSTVLVSAMDPLGNEVVERVEVVGVFDYRGLPWTAIVAAVTVSAGAVLFVRIPRRRAPSIADEGGEGLLEELDPIDGTSFGER